MIKQLICEIIDKNRLLLLAHRASGSFSVANKGHSLLRKSVKKNENLCNNYITFIFLIFFYRLFVSFTYRKELEAFGQ